MTERFADARVFVVDDNFSNVALLRAILTKAGYEHVFTESDSRQVLPRLPDINPDLVILDLHMPHLDGFAVLDQIRAFAPREYLPVLVLTADSTSEASQRALGAGAQDFVTKPYNNTEVLLRTRNLLETRFLYTTLRSSMVEQKLEKEVEERRLTEALVTQQQSTEQLRDLHGLKDTLMQTISHDLRNPISAVMTMASMLDADARGTQPLTPEMRSALIAKVAQSARKMEQLLRDLLDSDPMRTVGEHQQLCDVSEIVLRVLAEVDLGRDHPVVSQIETIKANVDPVHVERIVENLLANARQHVERGVTIWVRTAVVGQEAIISVEDAGPGVAPDVARTIFEPFRRGANARSEGFGLGLSLVSRFAQLQGGRAWVETRPGGGASFRVALPLPVAAAG